MPRKRIRYIEMNMNKTIRYNNVDRKNHESEPIKISLEGFEALRLYYYRGLSQEECAAQLNVSQPTFSRILKKANELLIKSIFEGRDFQICPNLKADVGYKQWVGWSCWKCDHIWRAVEKPNNCPKCNGNQVFHLNKLEIKWE
jgi:uncharacterized protein